ncbi:MAG: response regulator [Desulfobacteraceae bacterium]|nr:response regulator [Desulfobacteraceae bacterium]
MSTHVLIIDDEILLLQSLKDFLEDFDFNTRTAVNGQEGLTLVKEKTPDIVIVDLNMPVMDGYEFIKQAKEMHPILPIIALSGVGLIDEAMSAIRAGAWDFISKPVSDMQVVFHTIEKCLEKAHLIQENKKHQEHLEELVTQRTLQLENTKKQIINCLGKAAEFKDNETGLHVVRVAEMSYLLAQSMGLDEKFCKIIRDASPMHDVGKIGILDKVLLKKGSLNGKEWEHMKQHVNFGCSILSTEGEHDLDPACSPDELLKEDKGLEILTVAKRIALFHHECWDGKGYPFKLAGEKIPVEARIVSLVDVYDAVSSKRPYKEPFPERQCQDIIKQEAGTKFDPLIVDAFFNNLDGILDIKQRFLD